MRTTNYGVNCLVGVKIIGLTQICLGNFFALLRHEAHETLGYAENRAGHSFPLLWKGESAIQPRIRHALQKGRSECPLARAS